MSEHYPTNYEAVCPEQLRRKSKFGVMGSDSFLNTGPVTAASSERERAEYLALAYNGSGYTERQVDASVAIFREATKGMSGGDGGTDE